MEELVTKEELVEKYGNLVYSLTNYFTGYKSKDDLYQAGFIGLTTACNNFDPNYGVKFSTYAYSSILGEMKKLVREDKGIKISRNISKLNLQIEKARILLSQKLFRNPTILELSEYLGEDIGCIEEAILSTNALMSIDEPILNDENETSLHEVIPDKKVDLDTLIALKQELNNLSKQERSLIEKRYMEDMSQCEVANDLGMSQVQVSRYEQKIKAKIKSKLAA